MDIFTMHITRDEEILNTSPAYSWPLILTPARFISTAWENGERLSTVLTMGNPVSWWSGIPCILFCFYRFLGKRDGKAGFLVVAYLAQYLPWFFFLKVKFLYHYFPATLFMFLMMAYVADLLARGKPWGRKAVYAFLAVAVVVFFVFYPVISGYPSSREYQLSLRWLEGWFWYL
jgi:dolichyl-phosphate-mannose--protein O-mannosyl transferase